jgi:hypothetical protein
MQDQPMLPSRTSNIYLTFMIELRLLKGGYLRRKILLGAYAILIVSVLCGMIVGTVTLLCSGKKDLATRLAEVGDVLAGGTVLLAFIAALVALQAYAAAIGIPKLEIQIWFRFSGKNCPVFQMTENDYGELHTGDLPDQTTAMVFVRNRGSYSARNPVVILRFDSLKSDMANDFSAGSGWAFLDFPDESVNENSPSSAQWDGGANFSIHGHSARRLPDLALGNITYNPAWGTSRIRVEIAADGGYRRRRDIPVYFEIGNAESSILAKNRKQADWI